MSTITRLAKTAGKTPIKNTKVKNIKKRTTRNSSKTRKVEIYTDGDEQDEQQYEDCFEECFEDNDKYNNILKGLDITDDGKYVKLDSNLIERLEERQEIQERQRQETLETQERQPIPAAQAFRNCPEFLETLERGVPVTQEFLDYCENTMTGEDKRLAEMIGNIPLDLLAMQNSQMLKENWEYSIKMPINPKVTDQEGKGLCWVYAFLNGFRYDLISKFNLDTKFELSESYLFFYDKIERSNLFLEYMWTFRHRNLNDREVRLFTGCANSHMISDGGWYCFAENLYKKYGIVPKNIYGDSFNCKTSVYLNENLSMILNHMALEIFRGADTWTYEYFLEKKNGYMRTVYNLAVKFLGKPPRPTDVFTWVYRNSDDVTHTIPNLTAQKFSRTLIPAISDVMVIINDPRHPETYYTPCYSEYSTNMVDAPPANYINLPLNEFKRVICESLRRESPVWMACDIGKCFDFETNTSDTKRFDYNWLLGVDVDYSKADMLDMHTSSANHAMLFNGVDVIERDGQVTEYVKWRIENSWSSELEENSPDHGFYRMSDDYFDKYVYMAAVSLKYFEPEVLIKITHNIKAGKSFTYPFTDALCVQNLRQPCKCCHSKKTHTKTHSKNKYTK